MDDGFRCALPILRAVVSEVHAGGLPCAILVNHTTTAGGCERLPCAQVIYATYPELWLAHPVDLEHLELI